MPHPKNRRRLALLLALAVLLSWAVHNRPSRPAVPYVYQPLELPADLPLPDSRLIGLGTATHGNTEPVEAARLILERLQADGGAAFLLEENVGDAARVNELHAFYDPETRRRLGYLRTYDSEEMADLLAYLAKAGIRLYGVDIQSVKATVSVLQALPATAGFPDPGRLGTLNLSDPKALKELLPQRLALLDELEAHWDRRVREGALTEVDRAYAGYLSGSIRLHYEYVSGGKQSGDRDRLMAENALRVLELEKTYYGTRRALLLASNGHVVKKVFSTQYVPAGCTLAQALGEDYAVILTESRYNTFSANNSLNRQALFSIAREGPLPDALTPEGAVPRLVAGEELARYGAQGDITMVGYFFKNARTRDQRYYAVPMDLPAACDAVLLFRQLTPSRLLSHPT